MLIPEEIGPPIQPLEGTGIALRETSTRDLEALRAFLTGEVVQFTAPPPASDEELHAFLASLPERRRRGRLVCFCLTLPPSDEAIGIFQLWPAGEGVWGWGFALARDYWGQRLFTRSAALITSFARQTLGASALDGWCCVENARGNRALAAVSRASRLEKNTRDPGGLSGDFLVWRVDLASGAHPAPRSSITAS